MRSKKCETQNLKSFTVNLYKNKLIGDGAMMVYKHYITISQSEVKK